LTGRDGARRTSCTQLNLTMYSPVGRERSSEMSITESTIGPGGGTSNGE
jgi:hypothetical protein